MKRLLSTSLLLCTALAGNAAEPPKVINPAGDFVAFWDATQGMPGQERVAAFHQQVGARFPGCYGVQRFS